MVLYKRNVEKGFICKLSKIMVPGARCLVPLPSRLNLFLHSINNEMGRQEFKHN